VHLAVLDYDRSTPLNIYEYETVRDLIGKHLKIKITLKRAKDIPERFQYKTMAKYDWIDSDRTLFETQVQQRQRDPDFAYVHEHIELITEEFVETLMFHTLTIKVMGMIESKKKKSKRAYADSDGDDADPSDDGMPSARKGSTRRKSIVDSSRAAAAGGLDGDSRAVELARQNEELLAQIEELKRNGG